MLRNWLFWVLIVVLLIIAFLLAGCDSESPECRFESQIKVYAVNGTPYDRVKLNNQIVERCEIDSAAIFCYADGSPIEVGGLRFEVTYTGANYWVRAHSGSGYYVDTDEAGTVSTLTTEDSGYAIFTSWCEIWGLEWGASTGMQAKGKHTTSIPVASSGFNNWRDPYNYPNLIPWYFYETTYPYRKGGHYQCASSAFPNGSVNLASINPETPPQISNLLSPSNQSFLNNNQIQTDSGIIVNSSSWCMRAGKCGRGYAKDVTAITALNHSHKGTIEYRSTPYFHSLQIILEEPVSREHLFGISVPAKLYVGDDYVDTISSKVVAVSDDNKRLIIQSDYLVPIDSEEFDSETIPSTVYDRWSSSEEPNDPAVEIYAPLLPEGIDPNTIDENHVFFENLDSQRNVPVYCFPIESGETMRIVFDGESLIPFIGELSQTWLSNDANFDMNNDGIVNFKDLVFE